MTLSFRQFNYRGFPLSPLKAENSHKIDIKALIEDYKARGLEKELSAKLTQFKAECAENPVLFKEYAYLEGEDFNDYIQDMKLAQEYAKENRVAIASIILDNWLGKALDDFETFETVHNYIDTDRMILRKGSVEAKLGQELIIPINMAEGSIIGIGKSCEEMNYSAPHGAGRLMSRTEAKKTIPLKEFREAMNGIYSTCVSKSTLDESPQAYKRLEDILPHIEKTVDVKKVIKPVYNFKAPE